LLSGGLVSIRPQDEVLVWNGRMLIVLLCIILLN
jgi:hypothetical protein